MLDFLKIREHTVFNYSYMPLIFKNERILKAVEHTLKINDINTRRYFYPSLNTLNYLKNKMQMPVSEDISKRILCMPLYSGLNSTDILKITNVIKQVLD